MRFLVGDDLDYHGGSYLSSRDGRFFHAFFDIRFSLFFVLICNRLDFLLVILLRGAYGDTTSVLYQVLVSDIFHSDPHPGNIAITFGEEASNTKLIWYDTGSVMECTDAWKSDLVRLSLAILKSDVTDIVVTLQEMQIIKKDKQSGKAVYKFIKMLLAENDSIQALSTMSSKDVMMSVNQIMDRDPIWRSTLRQSFVSNSQYVILGKSVVTINANCLALDPTFSLIPRATPIINKYLNSDGQGSTTNVAFREMMDLARNMMSMPGRVSMLEQQIGDIGEESSVVT